MITFIVLMDFPWKANHHNGSFPLPTLPKRQNRIKIKRICLLQNLQKVCQRSNVDQPSPKKFPNYVALMSSIIDVDPSVFEEATAK
jgi:hypothetical protein